MSSLGWCPTAGVSPDPLRSTTVQPE